MESPYLKGMIQKIHRFSLATPTRAVQSAPTSRPPGPCQNNHPVFKLNPGINRQPAAANVRVDDYTVRLIMTAVMSSGCGAVSMNCRTVCSNGAADVERRAVAGGEQLHVVS